MMLLPESFLFEGDSGEWEIEGE